MAVTVYKYQDTIADPSTGRPVPGAAVTVKHHAGGALAVLYDELGLTPQPNPVLTDSMGLFFFWAAAGTYDVSISLNGSSAERTGVPLGPVTAPVATTFATYIAAVALSTGVGSVTAADLTGNAPFTGNDSLLYFVKMSSNTNILYDVEIWEGAVLKYQYLNIQQLAYDDVAFALHFSEPTPTLTLKITNKTGGAATVSVTFCGQVVS